MSPINKEYLRKFIEVCFGFRCAIENTQKTRKWNKLKSQNFISDFDVGHWSNIFPREPGNFLLSSGDFVHFWQVKFNLNSQIENTGKNSIKMKGTIIFCKVFKQPR